MDYPSGQFYYHYTTRSAAFEHIIPTGKLRLSPYIRMNDPLENKPWRWQGRFGVEGKTDVEAPQQALIEFDWGARVIWASAKLLSLTVDAEKGYGGKARPFGRGWSRARMWDQYAEQHQGACLLFHRARLRKNLVRSLSSQKLAQPYYKAIRYTAGGPAERLLELDLAALANNVTPAVVRKFVEDHNDELFFLKTRDWETEHEYRFVVTAPDVEYLFVEYGDALEAVIVGERFPAWQQAGAIGTCRQVGAAVGQMNWSSGIPHAEIITTKLTGGEREKH